jgi:hypothetical protein
MTPYRLLIAIKHALPKCRVVDFSLLNGGLLKKIYGRLYEVTPLESPVASSEDEDKISFRMDTGFKVPCEP